VAPGAFTALLRELARSPATEAPPFVRGDVVGRFEIVRKLGQGGFGVVYEAFDRTLRRAVAFKVVRTGGDVGLKEERIAREAEAAAQLSHPNLVTLHDVGQCDRGPYLVMELLRGRTLAERLRDGKLPVPEALAIALEVAQGVAHAHARGVVHRDVTPANVFLCEDGRVKILDFGLALAFGSARVHGGTVAYMAPEQWRGEAEDARTDVFALGVVLHEMLSGARPFDTPEGLGQAPRLELPGAAPLATLVARMMAAEPEGRPRDGGEVLGELQAIAAPRARPAARRPSRRRRRPVAAALAVAGLAVVAGAIAAARRVPETAAGAAPNSATAPVLAPPSTAPPPVVPVVDAGAPRPADVAPVVAPPGPAASEAVVPPPPRAPRRERFRPPRPPEEAPPKPEAPPRPEPAPPAPVPAPRECRAGIGSLAPPPRATGEGILTILADPFGAYAIDGEPRGDTPAECRLAAGVHTVRVVHPTLGARDARVRVEPGTRTTWAADLLSPE
jgi:serine/threonine protein kinase